jgi:23S rRNA G2445 N2-methylase RlmL
MARTLAPFGVRARFDWQASRAENWDLAARLVRIGSVLVNAPREADWDLMIDQMAGRIVARPKSWFDLRFDYREKDVPASSHAPLAAALAWLAHHLPWGRARLEEVPSPGKGAGTNAIFPGEGEGLVVWDPFCGAGTELIEAGLLNPRAQLIGSDLDPRAIEAARYNARRAGVKVNWITGDFRQIAEQIGPVDIILTNPPLGRRVAAGEALALADELIVLAARKLAPGKGRMVWVAPDPARATVAATRAGLRIQSTRHVDLGGFDGEIQILLV